MERPKQPRAAIGGALAGAIALVLGAVLTLPTPMLRPDLSLALQAATGCVAAVLAAVAGASALREGSPARLALAGGLGVLGFQALAFGVVWQLTAPLTIRGPGGELTITSPNAGAVGPLAWQAGWAVAAVLFLVAAFAPSEGGRGALAPAARRFLLPAVLVVAGTDLALLLLRPTLDGGTLRTLAGERVPAAGVLGPVSWLFAMVSIGALAGAVWMRWLRPEQRDGRGGRAVGWLDGAWFGAVALQIAVLTRPTEATPFVQVADLLQPLILASVLIALLSHVGPAGGGAADGQGPGGTDERTAGQAEIASMAAHEIRGPVAAIRGVVATSLRHHEELSADERRELLEMLDEESGQLLVTVDQVTLALRLEAGSIELDRREADVAEVVREAVTAATDDTAGRRVHVLVEEGMTAELDRARIVEALHQVLRNAAAYSPEDTPVVVRAVREDHEVVIDVIDEGPGIPPERREEVFGRFVLWRPPGYERRRSSGLGLFITRSIVRAHGGEASAEDAPGGGTMLRVRLPLERGLP